MTFCPLYSGSSGNCTYVSDGKTGILIDAGLSGKQIIDALSLIGVLPETLSGIVITHEHSDHVKGAGILSRRFHVPLYANEGTWQGMARLVGQIPAGLNRTFETGRDFYVDGLAVHPFAIPHDANDPVGFRVYAGARSVATATDMGYVRKEVLEELRSADMVLFESNHDPDMLRQNPHYTSALKQRILGRRGHLSNEDCGHGICALAERDVRHVVLGHLSGENNTPELAMDTSLSILTREGITPNEDISLYMAWRDHVGQVYSIA